MGCIESLDYTNEYTCNINELKDHIDIRAKDMNCSYIDFDSIEKYNIWEECKKFYNKKLGYIIYNIVYSLQGYIPISYDHVFYNNLYKHEHEIAATADLLDFEKVNSIKHKTKHFVYYYPRGTADPLRQIIQIKLLEIQKQFITEVLES